MLAFLLAAALLDLSYPFDARTLYWPSPEGGFKLRQLHHGKTPAGYFYSSNAFCAPEHGGTHLDAPVHFAEGKLAVDAIPVERLTGPALVIDVTAQAARDRDYRVTPADIVAFEKTQGIIAKGSIVLLRTGWAKKWPDRKAYFGDDKADNLHFPGLSADAARSLASRGVAGVGIDTPSIDHGPSKDFIAHQILAAADVYVLENVAAMDALPARGATLWALPMKIGGGSGAPVRVVAVVP